jgi:hypothetical protein
LDTEPDFEIAYIDSFITFVPATKKVKSVGQDEETSTDVTSDPTYRIGKLSSANRIPVSVKPDDLISKATTLMTLHDFSQLPVMTSDREVKGIITWATLGERLAFCKECKVVSDCMVPHKEISYNAYIFSAVDDIISNQYVLIRNSTKIICGIVTTSDLSQQFRQLGEPFLLLGEIENYLRRITGDKFTAEELKGVCDPTDTARKIESISDLTLGEYQRLIENPSNWDKLCIRVNRDIFVNKLDEIRRIRNDVMHFDPDGIASEDLIKLRDFVRLMQKAV